MGFKSLLYILLLSPLGAFAQTSSLPLNETKQEAVKPPQETGAPVIAPAEPKVERIEVTGSHIKRIDSEGPSPVQTITRKELDRTGYNSVGDVLRDTTVNSFG